MSIKDAKLGTWGTENVITVSNYNVLLLLLVRANMNQNLKRYF